MKRVLAVAIAVTLGASCSGGEPPNDSTPRPTQTAALPASIDLDPYEPEIDLADFSDDVDNRYFPLPAGRTWRYESETEDGLETVEVVVTDETKEVMGIDVVVVRDTVKLDGETVEDTRDWFAQDAEGNVWYMGEDSYEYEDGERVSDEGSWEAGVDGAQPGIIMPADPTVGQHYRQEFYEGEAEDTGEVIETGESVEVEAGSYDDVVVTEDLNPFEPDVVENKYYAPDVGLVFEEKVEGADEKLELVEVIND